MAPARCETSEPADARIEHHRHLAGRHLARIEPRDGALAGAAADLFGRFEIGGVQRTDE